MINNKISEYGFLLDMDGVLYRGKKLIQGAGDFINELIHKERQCRQDISPRRVCCEP